MLRNVTTAVFRAALSDARQASDLIATYTSEPADMPGSGDYYLSDDGLSGVGVQDGEMIGVFSLVKGRGDLLISVAVENGAVHGDCFDGYLPTLYGRHGFREIRREANWTVGGPDVVYMAA